MKNGISENAKKLARELRKRQTKAEQILWVVLRNRRFHGKKVLRQHPIYQGDSFFIADFYCHEDRLVVEIDGEIHESQREYDDSRTLILRGMNIRVIRFKNTEVENNLPEVLKKLENILT